jgi:hypothetical protein
MFSFVAFVKIFVSFGTFPFSASCEDGHFFGCHYSRLSIAKGVCKERSLQSGSIWHNIETSDGEVFMEVSRNCSYYVKDIDVIKIAAFSTICTLFAFYNEIRCRSL